jgi:hypothetical protein
MAQESIAELPAGPPEGSGGFRPFPHRPGVAELPAGPVYMLDREVAAELFRLRDRVHALESQLVASRLYPRLPGRSELPPFEPRETFFSGELRGPDYGGATLGDILKALLAILAALVPNQPPTNPAEIPR